MYQKEDENEIKKSDGCYTCHNDVSLFIQHDDVWADKKEDSEPLVINYISARGETDAALKTLKKLAEDYKKITRILNSM